MVLIRGRYEPIETVGSGGQGHVLRARDHQHDRQVAVKVRKAATDASRASILAEGGILLSLRPHPGVPLLREDFFVGDRYHLVMDWVEGQTLLDVLAERGSPGLPPSTVLAHLVPIADALDHLHAHDPPIVHLDVKPANLILTPDERVMLVDFGIAVPEGAGRAAGSGTRGYAAPELIRGDPPSPATDVYGLAASAVALLTGQPPAGSLPAWEGLDPTVAEALERALRRGLSTDPSRRQASAGELLIQLREALEARPLPEGTLTLLLAEVAGSTPMWEAEPDVMESATRRLGFLLADEVERHRGRIVATEGDARMAVFGHASDTAAAALAIQRAVGRESWRTSMPLRLGMALHTGEVRLRGGAYRGEALERAARLRALASGGQVLLSAAAAGLVAGQLPTDAGLRDLGFQRLSDLAAPERVHQLIHPDLPAEFPVLPSLGELPNNLPVQMTTFVGREREMGEVRALLGGTRLLTLTGAGGVGKTRLAEQVAAELVESYEDGVWLVELSPITDPGLVPQAIATALGVREEPGRVIVQTLLEQLRSKQLLLLPDNCEHLIDACAEMVEALLRACPGLVVLATSRQPLAIAGETTWRVPSMAVPEGALPSEALEEQESVRLFVDRAASARPGFEPTEGNLEAIGRICSRLDGIPLAIELAAARVRMLAVEEIAERLEDRFALLTDGLRTAPERQQTLRQTIDWSYDFLNDEERTLLDRLSVFAGGFTLRAAEDICAGEGLESDRILGALAGLVDKSLVLSEEEERYRLLGTIRQYAAERLAASEQGVRIRDRHLDWFLALAEKAAAEAEGPVQRASFHLFDSERNDLRAGLAWSLERPKPELGLRLAVALAAWWRTRGYWDEGRGWLAQLVEVPATPPLLRSVALRAAGEIATDQGLYSSARELLERALSGADEANDQGARLDTMTTLARTLAQQSAYEAAVPLLKDAIVLARRRDARRNLAVCLGYLGSILTWQGRLQEAAAYLSEDLDIQEQLGNAARAGGAIRALGVLALFQGGHRIARQRFEEGLALAKEAGDAWGICTTTSELGRLALIQGEGTRARELLEDSLAMARTLGEQQGMAITLGDLGRLATEEGHIEDALALHREAIAAWRVLDDPHGMAEALEGIAITFGRLDEHERAARLLGVAGSLREKLEMPVPPFWQTAVEGTRGSAIHALGEDRFLDAVRQGREAGPEGSSVSALVD